MTTIRRTGFLNVLAYIAVITVGVMLALSWIFSKTGGGSTIISALQVIASCLAYFVVACISFNFARSKGIGWLVAWIISVVLIIIFQVLVII